MATMLPRQEECIIVDLYLYATSTNIVTQKCREQTDYRLIGHYIQIVDFFQHSLGSGLASSTVVATFYVSFRSHQTSKRISTSIYDGALSFVLSDRFRLIHRASIRHHSVEHFDHLTIPGTNTPR